MKCVITIVHLCRKRLSIVSCFHFYTFFYKQDQELHRTGFITKSLDPIWSISTGSLFMIDMTPEDFFSAATGLTFILEDYDALGKNDMLGSAQVLLDEILEGTGDRKEYEINVMPDAKMKGKKKSKLYLRFKQATQDDVDFMHEYEANKKNLGLYANESFVPLKMQGAKFMKKMHKKGPNGEVLNRVRPGPDLSRLEDDTKWLIDEDVDKEALQPSTEWIEVGSGTIGHLFLEVIKCDGLPKMDSGIHKTDAFVNMVFESNVVNSEVR